MAVIAAAVDRAAQALVEELLLIQEGSIEDARILAYDIPDALLRGRVLAILDAQEDADAGSAGTGRPLV